MRALLILVLTALLLSSAVAACAPVENGEYDHRSGGRD